MGKVLGKYLLLAATTITFILGTAFSKVNQVSIPIWFADFEIQIGHIQNPGDTIFYNKSSKESFKFIFYDKRGKSYCEYYTNGHLSEKGNFANSLDTLKRYKSSRHSNGTTSSIKVESFFQPLKNGEWLIYRNGKLLRKETYVLGIQKSKQQPFPANEAN